MTSDSIQKQLYSFAVYRTYFYVNFNLPVTSVQNFTADTVILLKEYVQKIIDESIE